MALFPPSLPSPPPGSTLVVFPSPPLIHFFFDFLFFLSSFLSLFYLDYRIARDVSSRGHCLKSGSILSRVETKLFLPVPDLFAPSFFLFLVFNPDCCGPVVRSVRGEVWDTRAQLLGVRHGNRVEWRKSVCRMPRMLRFVGHSAVI